MCIALWSLLNQVDEDLKNGVVGAVPIPVDGGKEEVISAIVANVRAMIKADRKITALKQLQVRPDLFFYAEFSDRKKNEQLRNLVQWVKCCQFWSCKQIFEPQEFCFGPRRWFWSIESFVYNLIQLLWIFQYIFLLYLWGDDRIETTKNLFSQKNENVTYLSQI